MDPAFCDEASWFQRQSMNFIRGVTVPRLAREIPDPFFPLAFVNGGVAVVAPVGQGIIYDKNLFKAQSVFITGFSGDEITIPDFHAQNIAEILPTAKIAHFSIRDGHHFAFIAPFAKRVTDHEHIDAAMDPSGFDREQFLDNLNAELVEFFVANSK